MTEAVSPIEQESHAGWIAVSAAFSALGRVFLCLDSQFHVLHASWGLDDLLGAGATREVEGRPAEEILGADLFGAAAPLRQALSSGERREGWRAILRRADGEGTRLVSVTAAPFCHPPEAICDPRVAFVVVLRAGEEEPEPNSAPIVFGGMLVRSASMTRILRLIENLEHSEATVLLTGESGTGKEVVARTIHGSSPRRNGPFVAVNCGALPGELLESELFGHVRGAFTGAVRERVGRFELANGGTLFLDEVGDLPLSLQVKLLRVLQERTYERVGESRSRTSDARIIAATNRDLRRAVLEGGFREDLFYRLRVVPIEIPPLRERREDVDPLARALLARVASRQGRSLRYSPEALRALLAHHWPGNVRELENALEYAVAVCRGQTILPEDLPAEIHAPPRKAPEAIVPSESTPRIPAEAQQLYGLLEEHRWKRAEVARALGISRTTLWRRMREAGIDIDGSTNVSS